MAGCCTDDHCQAPAAPDSRARRRALGIALAIHADMFRAEIIAGVAAGSSALQADDKDRAGGVPAGCSAGSGAERRSSPYAWRTICRPH